MLVNNRVCPGNCRHGTAARFEVSIFVAPSTIYQPSEVTLKVARPGLLWTVTGIVPRSRHVVKQGHFCARGAPFMCPCQTHLS